MKYAILLAVLLCFGSEVVKAEEHLAPCNDTLHDYEQRVSALLHKSIPGTIEFSAIVIPSFTPEWGVIVSKDGEKLLLSSVTLDRSFWYSSWVKSGNDAMTNDPSAGHANPITSTIRITPELYSALKAEWTRSIKDARRSEMNGFDGEIYKFMLSNTECASAWSPNPESRNGKLVAIVDALRDFASSKNGISSSGREAAIIKMLRALSHP